MVRRPDKFFGIFFKILITNKVTYPARKPATKPPKKPASAFTANAPPANPLTIAGLPPILVAIYPANTGIKKEKAAEPISLIPIKIAESLPTKPSSKKDKANIIPRSEEHTSELQSRGHLVCRLLLEKKK